MNLTALRRALFALLLMPLLVAANPVAEMPPKLVMIGASYVQEWPVSELAGIQVINRGITGQQSWEVLDRFPQDAAALQPDAILIWGFINDIHNGKREQIEQVQERARASLKTMVEQARAAGATPILATEVTLRGPVGWLDGFKFWVGGLLGKKSYQEYVNGEVMATNAWLKELAAEQGVLLLDIQPMISDENGFRRPEYAEADGSHLSPEAYEVLTERVGRQLKEWRENGRLQLGSR